MKKIALIFALLALSGCHKNEYKDVKFPEMPAELSDCQFFNMSNKDGYRITVARCPNSTTTTTYSAGKTQQSVVVVDGVEYTKKEPEAPKVNEAPPVKTPQSVVVIDGVEYVKKESDATKATDAAKDAVVQ